MSEDKRWQNRVELSLDNRQIFLLFFASAAVLALVFALGVVVGKRSDTVPGKAASTDPLALLDQMGADSGEETLTFHEALTKTEPPRADPTASAPPAAPSASSPDPKPAAAPAPSAPPSPPLTPDPAEKRQRAAPAQKSIVKALAAAIPGAQARGVDESDSSSGKKPTLKPTKEPLAAKSEKGKKAEAKEAADGEGTYTLQLSAFQEKREAEAFMQKLRGSGMQPFMTSTTIPGRGVWFRVRLGKYRTWEEALAAKQDFEKKAKLIAYVSKN